MQGTTGMLKLWGYINADYVSFHGVYLIFACKKILYSGITGCLLCRTKPQVQSRSTATTLSQIHPAPPLFQGIHFAEKPAYLRAELQRHCSSLPEREFAIPCSLSCSLGIFSCLGST